MTTGVKVDGKQSPSRTHKRPPARPKTPEQVGTRPMTAEVKINGAQDPSRTPRRAPAGPKGPESLRSHGRASHLGRTWLPPLGALTILLAGFGVGVATRSNSDAQDVRERLTAARAETAAKRADAPTARGESQDPRAETETARGRSDASIQQEAANEGELVTPGTGLADLEVEPSAPAIELDQPAAELQTTPERIEGTFGDGMYQVGVDIFAGTYRTEGGTYCYWAKLGSWGTPNYIADHFGAGPQTLVIDSPWFRSTGCGTWVLNP